MGGAIAEGNMTPAAEFNVWADPEAAQAVVHAEIDITMIGLDVTHRAVTGPDVQRRLREAGSIGVFVAELVDFFTVYHRQTYGWDGAPIHDAVAVAHLVRLGLVEQSSGTSRSSSTRSSAAAGRSSTCGRGRIGGPTPTSVSTSTPRRSSTSWSSASQGWADDFSPSGIRRSGLRRLIPRPRRGTPLKAPAVAVANPSCFLAKRNPHERTPPPDPPPAARADP